MLEGASWVSQIVRGVLDQASYLKSAMICGVVLDERSSIVTVYTGDPNIFFPVGNLTES